MKRRDFLRTIGATTTAMAGLPSPGRASETINRKPNIVLIMADDLGYETLGCYGGTSYKTPHLDGLARTGIRFAHGYSTPKCVPSRVCLLTGRYGFRNYAGWGEIPGDEITFGHILGRAGYAAALAGKWQLCLLKDNPRHVAHMGFNENCCWAWHEGPRYWQPRIWQNGEVRRDIDDRYGPEVFTEFLCDFIKRNRAGPFLAYYPMCLTHFPKSHEPKGPNGCWETYAEMVANMDAMVGKIVATLDTLGIRETTLVLFTGDNGTPGRVTSMLGDRAIRGGKGTHTDAGTHVPLIANWPGTAPAGTVCDDLIDFSDFLPTFADLAGAPLPDGVTIDGRSFAPQLRGREGQPREWVYTQWKGKAWARTKRWKLYRSGDLYDVPNDPLEKHPVDPQSASPEARAARARLQTVLNRLREP